YVIERMGYYTALERYILPDSHIGGELKTEFEKQVQDLYEHILEFQLRSILRFYQCGVKNLARDIFRLDTWNDMVSEIKNREKTIVEQSNHIYTVAQFKELKKLTTVVQKMERMAEESQDYREAQEELKCYELFLLTDTSKTGYEDYKNRVE